MHLSPNHAHTAQYCAGSRSSLSTTRSSLSRLPSLQAHALGHPSATAAAAAAIVVQSHHRHQAAATNSSSRSAVAAQARSASSRASPPPVSTTSQPLDPLIQVAVSTTSSGVAKAVLLRLQQLGHAEVWATSAANHYTAVSGLGLAAQQLQQQQQVQQQQQDGVDGGQQPLLMGLAATAVLQAHDQPVKDQQKRRLFKLQLQVQPAAQLEPALLLPPARGSESQQQQEQQLQRISSNRTTNIAEILGGLQQELLEPEGDDGISSRVKPGAVCVVEARGEQAVTRALKAALSLQAAAGQELLLRPVAGKVVDVVAEKRGQVAQLADGLLLVFTWGC